MRKTCCSLLLTCMFASSVSSYAADRRVRVRMATSEDMSAFDAQLEQQLEIEAPSARGTRSEAVGSAIARETGRVKARESSLKSGTTKAGTGIGIVDSDGGGSDADTQSGAGLGKSKGVGGAKEGFGAERPGKGPKKSR